MGNINSANKCDLQQYSDVCEMAECLQEFSSTSTIVGLNADSASLSDTWIVKFKDGTTYDEEPMQKAFLKMWISNSSYKGLNENNFQFSPAIPNDQSIFERNRDKQIIVNSGLNYEARVYRDIVKPMIEKNICPNFVKFLGLGKNCSPESLLKMLKHQNPNENLNSNQLFGNAVAMMCNWKRLKITERYSASQIAKFEKHMSKETFQQNITYNIIANEVIKPDTMDFSRFLRDHKMFINGTTPNPVVWNVIFQILAACYSMSKTKMNHNDLHLGNIYIEPVDDSGNSKRFNYEYENTLFTFESRYIAKVYDFDRSYVTRFGDNPILGDGVTSEACVRGSQCNEFIPNLDALKIMGGISLTKWRSEPKTHKLIVDSCTSSDPSQRAILNEIFSNSNFLRGADNKREPNLEKFDSVFQIMKNISALSNIQNIYPSGYVPELKDVFICNQSMFNLSGKILEKFTRTQQDNTVVETLKQQIVELKEQVESLKDQLQKDSRKPPPKGAPCPPGEVRDKDTKECRPTMRKSRPIPKPPCPPDLPIRDKQTGECREDRRKKKK